MWKYLTARIFHIYALNFRGKVLKYYLEAVSLPKLNNISLEYGSEKCYHIAGFLLFNPRCITVLYKTS